MQTSTTQNGDTQNQGNQENIPFSINQILSPEGEGLENRSGGCNGHLEREDNAHETVHQHEDFFENEVCKGDAEHSNSVCYSRQNDNTYYSGSLDGYCNGYYNGQYYPSNRLSDSSFYPNSYARSQRSNYFGNKLGYAQSYGSYSGRTGGNNVLQNDINSLGSCYFDCGGIGNDLDHRSGYKYMKNHSVGSNGNSVSSGSTGTQNGDCLGDSVSPIDLSPPIPSSSSRPFENETNKVNLVDNRQRNIVENMSMDDTNRYNGAFSASNYYNSYCSGYAAAAAAASFFNGGIAPSTGGVGSLSMPALSPVVPQTHHHFNHQAAAVAAVGSAVAAAGNGGVIRVPAQRASTLTRRPALLGTTFAWMESRRDRMALTRRVGHPYQSRTPPKKKKPRTSFTRIQICELEKRFHRQKYLASSERASLAKKFKNDRCPSEDVVSKSENEMETTDRRREGSRTPSCTKTDDAVATRSVIQNPHYSSRSYLLTERITICPA